MPKRWLALRSRYSIPSTGSILPTKIEVRCDRVGIHSSWARSTSRKSPRLKSRPVRGTKFTLSVPTRLSPMPALVARLISFRMKPGAPFESMLSKRCDPGRFAQVGGLAPRIDGRGQQVAQKHPAVAALVLRKQQISIVAHDARAVALGGEEPEIDVAAHDHVGPAGDHQLLCLAQLRLQQLHLLRAAARRWGARPPAVQGRGSGALSSASSAASVAAAAAGRQRRRLGGGHHAGEQKYGKGRTASWSQARLLGKGGRGDQLRRRRGAGQRLHELDQRRPLRARPGTAGASGPSGMPGASGEPPRS